MQDNRSVGTGNVPTCIQDLRHDPHAKKGLIFPESVGSVYICLCKEKEMDQPTSYIDDSFLVFIYNLVLI